MMCSEEPVQFQLPPYFTTNDLDEILSFYGDQPSEPVTSNSSPEQATSNSSPNSGSGSGSDDLLIDRAVEFQMSEKRQRRKESNRESARRSRLRKKWHLDNLTVQVNRLTAQNREYKKWLSFALYHCQLAARDNKRLRVESVLLQKRLSDLNRVVYRDAAFNDFAAMRRQQQLLQQQQQIAQQMASNGVMINDLININGHDCATAAAAAPTSSLDGINGLNFASQDPRFNGLINTKINK